MSSKSRVAWRLHRFGDVASCVVKIKSASTIVVETHIGTKKLAREIFQGEAQAVTAARAKRLDLLREGWRDA